MDEGLIDRIGYLSDGIKLAKDMAGIKKARAVIYHRPSSYTANAYSSAMAGAGGLEALINFEIPEWLSPSRTQFLYLWQPVFE